jgi:integrase
LEHALETFLSWEFEEGTMTTYRRVGSELERFCRHHHLEVAEHPAALWILSVYLDSSRKTSLSTVYNYAKVTSAILGHVGLELATGELRIIKKVLVRMGALVPERQAVPLSKHEVYEFLTRPDVPEGEKMTIFLLWKTAGRASDLQRLQVKNIHRVMVNGRTMLVCLWTPECHPNPILGGRLKHQRGITKSVVIAIDCPRMLARVERHLIGRKQASPYDAAAVTRILKRIRPEYTGHSPRRGAIKHLLEQGCKVDLVVRMCRHAQPLDMPIHTQQYMPQVALALALCTQEATIML